jgi:hypothetical protein
MPPALSQVAERCQNETRYFYWSICQPGWVTPYRLGATAMRTGSSAIRKLIPENGATGMWNQRSLVPI